MAVATPCQTPGAVFHTAITPGRITLVVDVPAGFRLTEPQAAQLEADLHNAAELAIARWWPTWRAWPAAEWPPVDRKGRDHLDQRDEERVLREDLARHDREDRTRG